MSRDTKLELFIKEQIIKAVKDSNINSLVEKTIREKVDEKIRIQYKDDN